MAYQSIDHGSLTGHSRFGLGALGQAGQRSVAAVLIWLDRYHSRSALSRLDDHMLRDIGLSSADVEQEAGKPFWRA